MTGGQRLRAVALAAAVLVGAAGSPAAAQVAVRMEGGEARMRVVSWRDIPFRTVVRQEHDFSCGSAALATLLTYHYGRPTTEAQAFGAMYAHGDPALIQKVGFSMLDMKRYLASVRLRADGFRISLDELAALRRPAIGLINLGSYRHFVVIKGVEGDRVLVGDPAQGLRTYRRADFQRMWNGVAFALHDGAAPGAPVFNLASEWAPWSRAPMGQPNGWDTLTTLTSNQMPLYQIAPLRVLESAY
jgi:uncharacterized protein